MRKFLVAACLAALLSGCGLSAAHTTADPEEESVYGDCLPEQLTVDAEGADSDETEELLPAEFVSIFLYDTSPTLMEYLYHNPIDADHAWEEREIFIYSTPDINERVGRYHDIWEREMQIVYGNLLAGLSGEARERLEQSQAMWESGSRNDYDLWYDIFELSKGRGTGDSAMIHYQSMDRVRKRTFLLAEYQYWLTGEFVFAYPDYH